MEGFMTARRDAEMAVRKLFRKHPVADLATLYEGLGTESRMTVFRRLRLVGYHTSYTDAGRYYTLSGIPQFDKLGLWFHGDVGFSRAGTLKETAAVQVEEAPTGVTHRELRDLLRVRVYNTLLDLERGGRIGRSRFRGRCLYVSANPERAAEQAARREELDRVLRDALRVVTDEEMLEVLAEALRAAPEVPRAEEVSERLRGRGLDLTVRLVMQAYETHGLVPGKKASARSRSCRR
ncbi:MAG: hypothetical protein FJ087_03925 [Deltaproteobacteria bacterium]|nr:hypothetical protein [Deltaproteobacteria bacterium]